MANKQFLDPDGYRKIIAELVESEEFLKKAYEQLKDSPAQTAIGLCQNKNTIKNYRTNVNNTRLTINQLVEAMRRYLRKYEDSQCVSVTGSNASCPVNPVFGTFGSVFRSSSAERNDYSKSITYRFGVDAKLSFDQYNDASQNFIYTGKYLDLEQKAGFRYINKYWVWAESLVDGNMKLPANSQKRMIQSGIQKILEGMPTTTVRTVKDPKKEFGNMLGIPNFDKYYSLFMKLYNKWAKDQNDLKDLEYKRLKECAWYREMLAELPADQAKKFEKALKKEYTNAFSRVGKNIGTVDKMLKFIKSSMEMNIHFTTNYSEQVEYLDAMQDSLLAAGYDNAVLQDVLNDIKKQYESKAFYALEKAQNALIAEAQKGIEKKVYVRVPCLSEVDFAFDAIAGTTEVALGSEIKSIETLNSLQMYDYSLTKAHNYYVTLMEDGTATLEDVQNADKIYDILLRTKRSEYATMIELSRKHGIGDLNALEKKYDELNQMEYSGGEEYSDSDEKEFKKLYYK